MGPLILSLSLHSAILSQTFQIRLNADIADELKLVNVRQRIVMLCRTKWPRKMLNHFNNNKILRSFEDRILYLTTNALEGSSSHLRYIDQVGVS